MLKPSKEQYAAALHNADAENAKLNHKLAQLDALQKGLYVGDDLVAIGTLVQKRRDIDLDEKRMGIEEKELSAVLEDRQRLINKEQKRTGRLGRRQCADSHRRQDPERRCYARPACEC